VNHDVASRHGLSESIKIEAPFQELYHSHDKILELLKEQAEGSTEQKHLNVLIKLMDELFGNTVESVTRLLAEEMISYEHAWTLFPKGTLVYSRVQDQDRLYDVVHTSATSSTMSITCRFFRFDGSQFGSSETILRMPKFAGNSAISSLEVYPFKFHNKKSLEMQLVERGRRVTDFQGICYKEYHGIALEPKKSKKYQVSEHVNSSW